MYRCWWPPPGSYESFGSVACRRTYKINPRTAVAVQTIRRYADENGLAVWDMYEIHLAGIHRACLNWQEAIDTSDHVYTICWTVYRLHKASFVLPGLVKSL